MKQTFEIPNGCNRVTIEQLGRQIITTFEPEFKEGDILVKKYRPEFFGGREYIFILDNINPDGTINYKAHYSKETKMVTIGCDYGIGMIGDGMHLELRYATESERQLLFDALAKEGKQWNAEKKCIEDLKPKRWRAEYNHRYWYFDHQFRAVEAVEQGTVSDLARYNCGNYFKTKSDDEAAAEKIKEFLKQINL